MHVTFVRHSESVNNILHDQVRTDPDTHGKYYFETHRHPDAPLTERGVLQAERVGQRLSEEPFGPKVSMIITSYFHRALRTAAAVDSALRKVGGSPKVVVDRDFHEVGGHYKASLLPGTPREEDDSENEEYSAAHDAVPDHLEYVGSPGRTLDDVVSEFSHFHPRLDQGCGGGWWHHPGREAPQEASLRALRLWSRLFDIARRGETSELVVITHGYLYGMMMQQARVHGLFTKEPQGSFQLLQNTGVTRIHIGEGADHPVPDVGRLRKQSVSIMLENCGMHVAELGSLPSAKPPLLADDVVARLVGAVNATKDSAEATTSVKDDGFASAP